MPTYEYRCTECGHQYERREGFDAPASQRCPRCHGESRRVLYAPPILFKASGFYVTDNRKSHTARPGGLVGAASGGSNGGDGDKEIAGVEAAPKAEKKPAAQTGPSGSSSRTAKAAEKASEAAAG